MNAVRLIEHGRPGRFTFGEVPTPEPLASEVLVEVKACGMNHLDLWVEEGGLPVPIALPRIPGCEVAGVIAALGPGVQGWAVGDPVAVQSNLFCGTCEFCLRGDESLCLKGRILGVDRDGGLAERVSVPVSSLVRIPDGVGFDASAALTLAGSTAVHMLTDRTTVREGDWVLVMGAASGVGSAAIQIARHYGARVITTGRTEEKRDLGLRLGAEHAVDVTSDRWTSEVRKLTGRRGVDLVVEHVGGRVLEQCFECLARGGTIVTCGATIGQEITLNLWPLFVKQQRLIGSYGRHCRDMQTTLRAVADGWLQPVVGRVVPLSEASQALGALREGKVLGKVVVRP